VVGVNISNSGEPVGPLLQAPVVPAGIVQSIQGNVKKFTPEDQCGSQD